VLCESVESAGQDSEKLKLGFGEILARRAKQAHDAIVAARVTGRAQPLLRIDILELHTTSRAGSKQSSSDLNPFNTADSVRARMRWGA
jgi:hypothetical protein